MNKINVYLDFSFVVMITGNYWNGIEYQRHHFAKKFVENGTDVIFVERTPHRWPKFFNGDISQWLYRKGRREGRKHKKVYGGLTVVSPMLLPPAKWLCFVNRQIIKRCIPSYNKNKSGKPTLLITYVPSYNTIEIIRWLKPDIVAYVNVHNYEEDIVMSDLLKAEKEVIQLSDVLFADSTYNIKRLADLSGRNNVYPSLPGVEYALFHRAFRGNETKYCKTLYYFGGIGKHLDIQMYNKLAERFKVIFRGVVDPSIRNRISANIEIRKPVFNSVLPEKLKSADILTIFYKENPYINNVIPAKLFECFATAKPVLVSGLKEMSRYADIVYDVQGDIEKTIEIIKELPITETTEKIAKRNEIAKESDWSKRFELFVKNLNAAVVKAKPDNSWSPGVAPGTNFKKIFTKTDLDNDQS